MMAAWIDRKRLKAETRALLGPARVSPRGMTALYLGLAMALSTLDYLAGGGNAVLERNPVGIFTYVLTALLTAVLGAGFSLYCMAVRRGERPGLDGSLLRMEYRLIDARNAFLSRKSPAHGGENRLHVHIPLHGGGELLIERLHPRRKQQLCRHQRHKNAAASHQPQHQPQILCLQRLTFSGPASNAPGPAPRIGGNPPSRLP